MPRPRASATVSGSRPSTGGPARPEADRGRTRRGGGVGGASTARTPRGRVGVTSAHAGGPFRWSGPATSVLAARVAEPRSPAR
ncbi:hypothetical protein AAW14_18445 [Streptomyces hygroscopicus]|nr:hypothetical protein [Streptomyces hygroscopicus]